MSVLANIAQKPEALTAIADKLEANRERVLRRNLTIWQRMIERATDTDSPRVERLRKKVAETKKTLLTFG